MKPKHSSLQSSRIFGTSLTAMIVLSGSASAAEISYKTTAASTAEVTTATNWYGDVMPGAADIAAWKTDGDPETGGNQESRGGTLTISSPVSWLGLRHEDSVGALALTGSPITLGASGISQVLWEQLTISNHIVLGADQIWNNGNQLTLNGNVTGAFDLTKEGGGNLIFTGSTLGGGLLNIKAGELRIAPATPDSTVTAQSIRTQRDIRTDNNVLLDVATGSVGLSTAGGFWIRDNGAAATIGRLASSSGELLLASVDADGIVTTGAFTTVDHQVRTPIVDFDESRSLAVTKSGMNNLRFTAANTYSGGTTVNDSRLQIDNAAGLGAGAVEVTSGGQVWLNAAGGVYANDFTIAGIGQTEGTTNYGAIRFNNNTISGNVTIAAGGARIGGTGAGTISGDLYGGNVPLEINSTAEGANGAITLAGNASAYTGTTTLSQGSLTIATGTHFGGEVIKAADTTLINNGTIAGDHTHDIGILQGTGSFGGNLTLNGASAADVINVIPGALHVAGDLTLAGSTTVRASGLGGEVTVLTYDGTLTGDATNLSLEDAGSFRGDASFDTDVAGVITLNIDGADIVWNGGLINRDWDVTTYNWKNGVADDRYFQSDNVTFGDTGAGTVNIIGVIAPGSITVNNSYGSDYTFSGGGANVIGGTTGISKTGDGNLTLTSANTFLGAVTLGGGVTTFSARQAYTGGTTINSDAVLDLTGGGGGGGSIRGTVNVNGGTLRLSAGDATGYSGGTDQVSAINVSNFGWLEINNADGNQTFNNLALTLTGGYVIRGNGAHNGNFDLFGGGTSVTSLASADTSVIDYGVNVGLRQPNTTFTVASGATTSGIDLQINGSINNSAYNFTNPNLIKNGPGTLCLNNPPTGIGGTAIYSGTTTINEGTLMIGDGGGDGRIGTGEIIINNNSALVFNRFGEVVVPNTISGTGSLEQRGGWWGDGVLVLTGGGARSGDTMVNSGSLYIGSTPFTASSFKANSDGTISAGTPNSVGTGTVAGLDLNGGTANFRVSTALSDRLVVTDSNGFSVSGQSVISITPSGSLQAGDVIPLIEYSGSVGGIGLGAGNANLPLVSSGNPHLEFALVNNTGDSRVDLSVVKADSIIWIGNVNNVWDENGTSNWQTVSDSQTSRFYPFDKVRFTDAGSANTTVSLSTNVVPATVEFDASIDYILTGFGGISGSASLIKNNEGTTTLSNFNSYTGTTTINGGTLQIGDSGILGDTAITNNATLAFNVSTPRTDSHAIAGSGQLVKRGSGELTLAGNSTFTGPVVVEAGTLSMPVNNVSPGLFGTTDNGIIVHPGATFNTNGNGTPVGETISIAGTGVAGFALTGDGLLRGNLILTGDATIGSNNSGVAWELGTGSEPITITGDYTLTKAGTDRVWYRAPANGAGNTLAALVIDGGVFGFESNDNGISGVPITVNSNGGLSAWALSGGTTPSSQNNPITLNGGSLGADFTGVTWTGPVTLTADSYLGGERSFDFNISNVISQSGGSFGVTKTLASTVTLTAVNAYTGNTTVNEGGVTLAPNAGLTFVIGANGVNNKITGPGTATINGGFTLVLDGAAIANGNTWTLVDTATMEFGETFTIDGFTENADVHTMEVGDNQTWTFTESSGVLSLAVSGGDSDMFSDWLDANAPGQTVSDDHDFDGVPNGVEYFMGASGSGFTANPGVQDGKIVWPKSATYSGTYAIYTSPDLDIWTPQTEGIVDNGTSVEFTLPTGEGKLFVRLEVTPN